MLGQEARLKEKRTHKNKAQGKPLSLLPKARSKDRKEDDSETARRSGRTQRQSAEAVG